MPKYFKAAVIVTGVAAVLLGGYLWWQQKPIGEIEFTRILWQYAPYLPRQVPDSELVAAIIANDQARVDALIESSPELVNRSFDDGMTPLHWAVDKNNMYAVKALIAGGADLEAHEQGVTPLGRAVKRGHLDMVQLLFAEGARATIDDDPVFMPRKGRPKTTSDLIGVKSPLNEAVQHMEIFKWLIGNGADINGIDHQGKTPLMEAIRMENPIEDIEWMIAHGADMVAANLAGWSPLHFAARGPMETAELLVAYGVDVDARTFRGESPLFEAVREKNVAMMKLLIKNGADVTISDNYGTSLLEQAEIVYGEVPEEVIALLSR